MSENTLEVGDLCITTPFGENSDGTPRPQPIWHTTSPGSSCFNYVPSFSYCIVLERKGSMTQIALADDKHIKGFVYTEHLKKA